MLQSLKDIKSNNIDVCFQVVSVLLNIINDMLNNAHESKFRKIHLNSDLIQNELLPFAGAMEFLFEIGFIDDGNSLVLPHTITPDVLNRYKQELLKIILKRKTSLITIKNNFLKEICSTSLDVLKYENKVLQNKALEYLPFEDIELFSNFNENNIDLFHHNKLMLKLMKWFKESFFNWVDSPICQFCSSFTMFRGINHNTLETNVKYIEIFECKNCHLNTQFKRYDICEELLTTRNGRCSEWAHCFTLFCRALGWEARLVIDKTDHVWTEVWSVQQKRWIHCDPCETALDKPLLYEKGWGKKLSYVLAYSCEEVQDVTWRYTENINDVLKRRTLCTEKELLHTILSLSEQRQNNLLLIRHKYLAERRFKECIELLYQPKSTDAEKYSGRISGTLDWKLAQNKIQKSKKFIWTPTETEINNKKFELKYYAVLDLYIHDNIIVEGWENGVYNSSSLIRKEEMDWKMVYLCRKENCKRSTIEWQFDFSSTDLDIQSIKLFYTTTLFNNGEVEWKLISNDVTINLPIKNQKEVIIDKMNGSKIVTLSACLFGGSGESAWQHTQIFRQSMNDLDYPFQISFILKNT